MPICEGPASRQSAAGLMSGTVYQAARVADGDAERVCRAEKAQGYILGESRPRHRRRTNRLRIDE